jgi:hypothetical protein
MVKNGLHAGISLKAVGRAIAEGISYWLQHHEQDNL